MKKTFLLCMGLAVSAPACGDEALVQGSQLPDPGDDDPNDDPNDEEGTGSGDESGDGSLLDLGSDDEDPDPSRVFAAFPDGDDHIFHATVGDDVLGHYPDADHWAIRMTDDGVAIGLLVDANGTKLDLVRIRPQAPVFFPGEPETRQLCFPDIKDLTGPICVTEPCDWNDPLPGGEFLDCFEASLGSDGQHVTVMGSVDGIVVGWLGTDDGASDLTGAELGEVQIARMGVVGDLLDDLTAIVPDMTPFGPTCLECWWDEYVFGATIASCGVIGVVCLPGVLGQIEGVIECQEVEC